MATENPHFLAICGGSLGVIPEPSDGGSGITEVELI